MAKDTYSTLKSLNGLRLGVHYLDAPLSVAASCLGLNEAPVYCEGFRNVSVGF